MAALLFFAALVLALIHVGGGTWPHTHYLDLLFALISGGLFLLAIGWDPFRWGNRFGNRNVQ